MCTVIVMLFANTQCTRAPLLLENTDKIIIAMIKGKGLYCDASRRPQFLQKSLKLNVSS